jgi:YVTN family beta-propeller protein
MSEFLYVPNEGDNTVSVIDTSTDTVVATIPVGGDTAAVSPNGAFVYVASESGIVSVIDTASNSVVGTINVGSGAAIVTFNPDGTLAYVTHYGGNYVSVINTASDSVVATIPVGNGSYGTAFSRDGTHAYVTNESSGTVSVIDVASNSVINTITVGSRPTMIAVSPDGTHAYCQQLRQRHHFLHRHNKQLGCSHYHRRKRPLRHRHQSGRHSCLHCQR